jgi:hypothetical protein
MCFLGGRRRTYKHLDERPTENCGHSLDRETADTQPQTRRGLRLRRTD